MFQTKRENKFELFQGIRVELPREIRNSLILTSSNYAWEFGIFAAALFRWLSCTQYGRMAQRLAFDLRRQTVASWLARFLALAFPQRLHYRFLVLLTRTPAGTRLHYAWGWLTWHRFLLLRLFGLLARLPSVGTTQQCSTTGTPAVLGCK